MLNVYSYQDVLRVINKFTIYAINFLVADESILFLPIILLLLLILLSFYSTYFSEIAFDIFKLVSFFIYFYIFLHYMVIFCCYVHSTSVNYFLYKTLFTSHFFNFNISFGIDNYTIFFLLLTALLFPFCILIN